MKRLNVKYSIQKTSHKKFGSHRIRLGTEEEKKKYKNRYDSERIVEQKKNGIEGKGETEPFFSSFFFLYWYIIGNRLNGFSFLLFELFSFGKWEGTVISFFFYFTFIERKKRVHL